jgi:indolepyruvate ferredoxin oxidoreductase beta subunit
MNRNRPVGVLVAALGGQGGGVLADWLVAAARFDGLEAQATSIPGVAQRTGATTYYFEVVPQRDLPGRPVFSIYPASGAVDLVASLEPMEAARALAGGFVGQETTVITARERIFSTAEKIRPGDGTVSIAPILSTLQRCAGTTRAIDLGRVARGAKCHPNAVMFGVMAASSVLPMRLESCRQAIAGSGVAVADNLAGFEAGLTLPAEPASASDEPAVVFAPAPDAFADTIAALPDTVRQMAGHAAARLLDYQDAAYVRRYLDRLDRIVGADFASEDYRLSALVARRLAAWMAFEDVIRVAQLKTRPGRLARIRAEIGADNDVPVTVHDFLKPGRDELEGLLPASLGKWLPTRRASRHGTGLAFHLKTSGPFGWLAMRSLAALRFWRPRTVRFRREQDMIERWLQSVTVAAAADYALACSTADLAVWARGYGDVRHRGLARLAQFFTDWPRRIAADKEALSDAVRASLAAAYSDPDAEVTP